MIWAISVLRLNNVEFSIKDNSALISKHYITNYNKYDTESDHYYSNIVARFQDTASLFADLYGFNFEPYMKNASFLKR